ncbi:putative transcriptional regulator [Bacillus sp. TS-2]|nr:putative transcriptional regulator [Bacillus sp. TS-2]
MSDAIDHYDEETKRGRPLDLSRNEIIIEKTIELLAEVGFDSLTIEALAKRAKVGKATIYRRWASKEKIVIEAISSINPFATIIDKINQEQGLREQIIDLLCFSFQDEHELYQQAMTAIGSALPHNKELEQGIHSDFYEKHRSALSLILQPFLKENYSIESDKLDLLADIGPALLIYRMFILRKSYERNYIENIADHLMLPMVQKYLK